MAADGYVTIHRTTDAAQGELLAETLRSDGIDARFHRVSSALIGMPTSMIEMTIDVPARLEARARELLRDLEYVGASDTPPRTDEAGRRTSEKGAEEARAGARWRAVAARRVPLFLRRAPATSTRGGPGPRAAGAPGSALASAS